MTLRENNLKMIQGGDILESEGILIANKQSLMDRPGLLQVCSLASLVVFSSVGDFLQGGNWGALKLARRGSSQSRWDSHGKAHIFYPSLVPLPGALLPRRLSTS